MKSCQREYSFTIMALAKRVSATNGIRVWFWKVNAGDITAMSSSTDTTQRPERCVNLLRSVALHSF